TALAAFAFAPRFEAWLQRHLAHLPLPPAWRERLAGLLSQFLLGAKAFVNPGRAARFLALTALIWLLDGLGAVVFARGLGLALTLGQALLLLAALGLASALPSTPGYLGIYQLVAVSLMPAFGISPSQALAYILASQALNVLLIVVWGVIGLGRFRWGKEG
ncbi:MAG: lysylphosphatidylglycerol synthase domain-containing protein, partial [Anaerolineales bacterium]|nr:lysylphosphatidylglycerol synthase domain-containing protein [Anaerolineales bacterium]